MEPISLLPVEIEGGEKALRRRHLRSQDLEVGEHLLLDASLLRSIATLLSAHVVLHPRMISTFRMGTEMSCFISIVEKER